MLFYYQLEVLSVVQAQLYTINCFLLKYLYWKPVHASHKKKSALLSLFAAITNRLEKTFAPSRLHLTEQIQ